MSNDTLTKKEKIKEMLKKYSVLRSNSMIKLKQSRRDYPLSSIDLSQPSGGETHNIHSPTETYVLDIVGNKQVSNDLIRVAISIEEGLKSLFEKEEKVIRLKYFKGYEDLEIKNKMGKSVRQIQRYKNSALDKLKEVGVHTIYQKFKETIKEIR